MALFRAATVATKINGGLATPTRSQPLLGLVEGPRGPTQIHIRGLCYWAGEPSGHLGAESPSRRTAGPASARKQARLVHTDGTDRSGRGARMRCPSASVLCLSPPLVVLLLKRVAIRSGQSHPGFCTQPHQPGSGLGATVLARSDHSAATEEPAPSVTLPPTSVHVIVWCGDKPVVLRSLDDRCERHKRANRAWSVRWPASPKGRIESEPRGPSQLRGVRGVARMAPSQLRIVTVRHGLIFFVIIFPCFWSFWLAISEPGWTFRKKSPS